MKKNWLKTTIAPAALISAGLSSSQAFAQASDYNYGWALGVREAVLDYVSADEMRATGENGALLFQVDPSLTLKTKDYKNGNADGHRCVRNNVPAAVNYLGHGPLSAKQFKAAKPDVRKDVMASVLRICIPG